MNAGTKTQGIDTGFLLVTVQKMCVCVVVVNHIVYKQRPLLYLCVKDTAQHPFTQCISIYF